ncbi:MAG TPA: hypothetical protein DDY73_09180 [Coprobacter fastidiosus]|jgi:hypothetical protein|uniref:Uncharacterized protein n=1 Tax=Coprobacter fastidiosus TaxID=1099853 RepID=A0A354M3S4_9BACT|nr:hypothetical protein [Butyricimonas sp.]HAM84168.1 hypothetical protein [Butyricimonas sp.]HBJ09163.1 hypothetical protein [Coprobacter fastidiosus]
MYKENDESAIAKRYYSFSMAYSALSPKVQNKVRKEISELLGITERSFRLKMCGNIGCTTEQVSIIREVFRKYGLEKIFNYEYINQ